MRQEKPDNGRISRTSQLYLLQIGERDTTLSLTLREGNSERGDLS